MLRQAISAAAIAVAAPGAVTAEDEPFTHVSCKGKPNEIRVTVTNIKKSVGLIVADLYPNKADGFLHAAGRLQQVAFAAQSPSTSFCLYAPATGKFAVSIYHDENANKDFDKGAFGLPAEPYGVSNNPPMKFGAPKIGEAAFDVNADGATIAVRLRK